MTTIAESEGMSSSVAPLDESALTCAERLIDDGRVPEALPLLTEAMATASDHHPAYGRLVDLAIAARDSQALANLVSAHQSFVFDVPSEFRRRMGFFDLWRLRRTYSQAIQAAAAKRWPEAELGFARLFGDGAFHDQAVEWLFRIALEQRDYKRAEFIAEQARRPGTQEDPVRSADLYAACARQARRDRQEALGYLVRELGRQQAYAPAMESRRVAQQRVYGAVLRLHTDLDQCFRGAVTDLDQGRVLFPDLPHAITRFLVMPVEVSQ